MSANLDLNPRLIGASVRRVEDRRLTTGAARYLDDLERTCGEAGRRLSPPSDVTASADYRRAALGVLTARAIRAAAA